MGTAGAYSGRIGNDNDMRLEFTRTKSYPGAVKKESRGNENFEDATGGIVS